MDPVMQALLQRAGIAFDGFNARMLPEGMGIRDIVSVAMDGSLVAMDAAYPLVTNSNAGIPAMLSTHIDPKLIEVLVAPMKAAEASGSERKFGDWTARTWMFPVIENTGEVTSYGDYSANGSSGANFQFPQRQSYHYQTVTQWGERELANAGLAKVDYAARLNIASALALNKYQNLTYLFGVSGLQNYGMLNDPALPADLTPNTKAAGGTAWILPTGQNNATAIEVLADISKLYSALIVTTDGLITLDAPMTLIMSPASERALTITDQFNVNVKTLLTTNYPNLKIVTVPEYATASGQKVQLVLDEYEGQRTWDCAFTEKMRAHPIIQELSSFKQKKSAGTWGTVIFRPAFVQGMLGV